MSTLQENIQQIRNGCITTLLACQASALILMDYDVGQTSTSLSFGQFAINLALHLNCLLHATFCCVEGFVWPLARDTLVVRISKRSFVFALPGLLYGLQFPTSCQPQLISTFVEAFIQFAHYKDINDNGSGYLVEDNEPNIWNKVRPNIEALADETLKRLGHLPGRSRFMLPDLINACLIRATRMSVSTKQLIEGMKIGTLANTFVKFIHPSNNAHDDDQGSAYASVRAFSVFVDCVEIACLQGRGHVVNEEHLDLVCYHDTDFKLWEFTKEGFLAFMRILRSKRKEEELLNVSDQAKNNGKMTLRPRKGKLGKDFKQNKKSRN